MKFLNILSYNIHKGFNTGNRKFILDQIKKSILTTQSDIVFLQEVVGHHSSHSKKIESWPTNSQFEFLADQAWDHHVYGKNAVHTKGHHGNAILSKFSIASWANYDISTRFESRGILHVVLNDPQLKGPLHLFCIHFGLFRKDRKMQTEVLIDKIQEFVPKNAPLIIAGDFNDWREDLSIPLYKKIGLKEVFLASNGRHALTFPSKFPLLPLDRIYYKNLELDSVKIFDHNSWNRLSDHLPIYAKLKFPHTHCN